MGTALTSLKKIKSKYIGIWLKDQLSQPDWFRNLIVNRSAWGAFSVYAHARRSDGKAKISYKSKAKAEKAAFPWHGVSTEQYNSKYILNFSVCGEFKLEIYYLPNGDDEPKWLFRKSFCCK